MHHLSSQHPVHNLFRLALAALIAFSSLLSGCVTGNAPKPQPYLREQGDFFMQAGIESYTQYNFALATEQFTQAKNFYSRFDDYLGTTNAFLNLAQVQLASGKFDAAKDNLARADLLIRQHDLKQQAIYRDMLLTTLYLSTENMAEAEKIFAEYDQILRGNLADDATMALLVNRVRMAQLTDQDFSLWVDLLAQQTNKHNNVQLNARLQRFKAWQAFVSTDATLGNQLFAAVLESYRHQANPTGLMSTRLEWAQACSQSNDWPHAAEHYEQALHLAMSNNHVNNGLLALNGLQFVYQQTGQSDKQRQVDEWMKQLKTSPAGNGDANE